MPKRCALAMPLVVLSGGCMDLPEIRYETEHFRIGTDFDDELCEGNLVELENHLLLFEDRLDVDVTDPIELYLYEGEVSVPNCDPQGCADSRTRQLFTLWEVAGHEIGHAAQWEESGLIAADPLFSEGIAEAFSGRRTQRGHQHPSDALGNDLYQVDYWTAGHFVRWLHSEYGSTPLRTMMRISSDLNAAGAPADFQTAYGESIESIEDRYDEEAPELVPGDLFCDHPSLGTADDNINVNLDFDCSGPDTVFSGTVRTASTMTVEQAGTYEIDVDPSARLLIRYCHAQLVPAGATYDPELVSPVGQLEHAFNTKETQWLEPGRQELFLDAGTYRLDHSTEHVRAGSVHLRVRPRHGNGPPPGKGP